MQKNLVILWNHCTVGATLIFWLAWLKENKEKEVNDQYKGQRLETFAKNNTGFSLLVRCGLECWCFRIVWIDAAAPRAVSYTVHFRQSALTTSTWHKHLIRFSFTFTLLPRQQLGDLTPPPQHDMDSRQVWNLHFACDYWWGPRIVASYHI